MSQLGKKLNSSSRCAIGRLVAVDHRSGFFVLKKLKILRMNQAHRSAPSSRQRFDHPLPHPQKTTLTVGPLAASVRTEAGVTSGALKAKLANLTSKCLCPLFRTKVSRITGRT